jgi:uncharacterized membrane protein HdeD (DUF308 family)
MIDYMKRYAKGSIVLSICLIVVSLFLIFKPEVSLSVLFICLGCFLLVVGIMHTISYFSSPKEFKAFSFELIEGIVYIILGFVLIFNPNIIKAFLPIIIGCWMIINSIVRFQLAFNLKSSDNPSWALMLILSFVTLILGIVMVINPFASIAALTMICGIMLLISEIINIIESISMIRFLN